MIRDESSAVARCYAPDEERRDAARCRRASAAATARCTEKMAPSERRERQHSMMRRQRASERCDAPLIRQRDAEAAPYAELRRMPRR